MTYSLDFRRKALDIKNKENLSFEELATRFGVGKSTLVRWCRNLEPQKNRNKPATKIDMEALKQDVELYPDAYQYERAARLGVSKSGIGHALKRLKISNKKNTIAPKSQ